MASSPSKKDLASSSTDKLTMKLLIDTKDQKVLFAEASKPVIDFLFNLLCLPIGTVVRLLNQNGMVGCLGNLYKSVENLKDNYMVPNQDKDVLLKPKATISSTEIGGLLPANYDDSKDNLGSSFFICRNSGCPIRVTCYNTTPCPQCGRAMNYRVDYAGKKVANDKGNSIKSGFVKDMVPFMVMDDLVVEPMSTISSITLLNKFNVKDVGALQEMVVELGMDEGVKLLKASLESNMVLTSLFIKKTNVEVEKKSEENIIEKDIVMKEAPKKKRRRRML
ncbi:uncharacterized protein LOC130720032 [Lotus japonicus]|uniref:uncharacterized protein LOC130720032 n=1 Tax=Lotus japonicus TaxID=34305 RepID=UPI002590D15D|nr:uncharacterized protein LOC130720032 [Lotus japonicus]